MEAGSEFDFDSSDCDSNGQQSGDEVEPNWGTEAQPLANLDMGVGLPSSSPTLLPNYPTSSQLYANSDLQLLPSGSIDLDAVPTTLILSHCHKLTADAFTVQTFAHCHSKKVFS